MKRRICSLILILAIFLTGCAGNYEVVNRFDMNQISSSGNAASVEESFSYDTKELFSKQYCMPVENDIQIDGINSYFVKAAAVFDTTDNQVLYSKNMLKKRYPASITKILTALLVLKYGNIIDQVKVSENACTLPEGASRANLRANDVMSVEDLLYGMMLNSGNDAANALAEYLSGSGEEFAELMNKELKELHATDTHFVNANGIHNDDHYTTCYDLYLIFNECIKYDLFRKIISTTEYEGFVTHGNETTELLKFKNTNRYLFDEEYPSTISIVGGKTGTTYNAGHCLILLVNDKVGHDVIYICLGADSTEHMYEFFSSMLFTINR